MEGRSRASIYWGHHVAIAAAYTVSYDILRSLTYAHLAPTAGLRLICLLLVPRRYWTALVIGEALPIAAMAITAIDQLGPAFGMVSSLPTIVLCMPVVSWFMQHTRLKRADGGINIGRMLLLDASCALVSTAASCAAVYAPRAPDGGALYHMPGNEVVAFILGYYLGSLVITSTVLALRERSNSLATSLQWHHLRDSRLLRDVLFLQVPLLAFILIYIHVAGGDALAYGRMATVIPILMLAARHQWHGAAIGGALSAVVLTSTASGFYDPSLVPAQAVTAFTMSTCLIFGFGRVMRSPVTGRQPA